MLIHRKFWQQDFVIICVLIAIIIKRQSKRKRTTSKVYWCPKKSEQWLDTRDNFRNVWPGYGFLISKQAQIHIGSGITWENVHVTCGPACISSFKLFPLNDFTIYLQYQHVNQTKKDVVDILEQYRGLTFKLENFGEYHKCWQCQKERVRWCLIVWFYFSSLQWRYRQRIVKYQRNDSSGL